MYLLSQTKCDPSLGYYASNALLAFLRLRSKPGHAFDELLAGASRLDLILQYGVSSIDYRSEREVYVNVVSCASVLAYEGEVLYYMYVHLDSICVAHTMSVLMYVLTWISEASQRNVSAIPPPPIATLDLLRGTDAAFKLPAASVLLSDLLLLLLLLPVIVVACPIVSVACSSDACSPEGVRRNPIDDDTDLDR